MVYNSEFRRSTFKAPLLLACHTVSSESVRQGFTSTYELASVFSTAETDTGMALEISPSSVVKQTAEPNGDRCWCGSREVEDLFIAGECANWFSHYRNQCGGLHKLKNRYTICFSSTFLEILSKNSISYHRKPAHQCQFML